MDGNGPEVIDVNSTTADGTYDTGAAIDVTVQFSEPVDVIGTPQLTLETGSSDAVVNYASGSGGEEGKGTCWGSRASWSSGVSAA